MQLSFSVWLEYRRYRVCFWETVWVVMGRLVSQKEVCRWEWVDLSFWKFGTRCAGDKLFRCPLSSGCLSRCICSWLCGFRERVRCRRSWRSYLCALTLELVSWVVPPGYLPFGMMTAWCFYAHVGYFLRVWYDTHGGHEHGFIPLREAPIVVIVHSSNKYNDIQCINLSYYGTSRQWWC